MTDQLLLVLTPVLKTEVVLNITQVGLILVCLTVQNSCFVELFFDY